MIYQQFAQKIFVKFLFFLSLLKLLLILFLIMPVLESKFMNGHKTMEEAPERERKIIAPSYYFSYNKEVDCSETINKWKIDLNRQVKILEGWVETKMKVIRAEAFYELKHYQLDVRGKKIYRSLKRVKDRFFSRNKIMAFRSIQICSLKRSSQMHFKFMCEHFRFPSLNPFQLPTLGASESSLFKVKKQKMPFKEKKKENDHYGLDSFNQERNIFEEVFCRCFYHYYPRENEQNKIVYCQKMMKYTIGKKIKHHTNSKSKEFWKKYQRSQRK